jgi:hypothetical protein
VSDARQRRTLFVQS